MREIGVVESTNGHTAVVSVKRSTACGDSCATCASKCNLKGNKIKAENKACASVGDVVEIEMKTSTVLKSAFMVYILPLLFFFVGYFLSWHKTGSEPKSMLTGFIFFAVVFVFLLIWDKLNKDKFSTVIVNIMEKRT